MTIAGADYNQKAGSGRLERGSGAKSLLVSQDLAPHSRKTFTAIGVRSRVKIRPPSQYGPRHLTTAELLGIVCRTGVKGRSAVDLGRELLQSFGGLRGLSAAHPQDLETIKGLGKAKIAQLQAGVFSGSPQTHINTGCSL